MAKSVALSNGRFWKTQTAAIAYFKAMLHRYSDDAIIEGADDHDDLVALLERYDAAMVDACPKAVGGIDYFFRRLNRGEQWSSPGFWLARRDGTETDFSFYDAIRGQPKGAMRELYDACRNAVQSDILAAKDRHFRTNGDLDDRVPCDVTGVLLTSDLARLDYVYPPFIQIVVDFRTAFGWRESVPPGTLTPPGDGQVTTYFVSENDAAAFRAFHHERAVLRVITKNGAPPRSERLGTVKQAVDLSGFSSGVG